MTFLAGYICVFILLIIDYCDVVWILSSAMHLRDYTQIFQLEICCLQFSNYYFSRAAVLSHSYTGVYIIKQNCSIIST